MIKTIEELDPDFIVLTGDIVDSKTNDFDKTIDLLSDIKKVNKEIYSVSGNHEKENKKKKEFDLEMENLGIYDLNNKYVTLDVGQDKINLYGVPFIKKGEKKEEVYDALPEDLFTILLSHSPSQALEYKEFKKDLILSGHTHGGQVRLPFIGSIISPERDMFPRYDKGLYQIENYSLYIDSGLGNSIAPIRLFNRVQISYIEIQ